jgi:hypothetical protein
MLCHYKLFPNRDYCLATQFLGGAVDSVCMALMRWNGAILFVFAVQGKYKIVA